MVGENGIIRKAQNAKEWYNNGVISEEESMDTLLEEYNNAMSEPAVPELPDITPTTPAGTQVKIPADAGWTSTQVIAISDGSGNAIPLPNDFYYVGGDYGTGLVISDKQGDTMTASGTSMGNQFVWIPVASESDLTRTLFDSSTGQPKTGLSTDYTEPYASGYSDGNGTEEASEYNAMRTKVLQYGGFYIGRYEAGINSTTLRTGGTTAQTVVSKKGVAPYNYVPWGAGMSDASEVSGNSGAVYLAKNFATQEGYTSVTSTLCYGSQWDAMCRYIGDSHRTTPTKSAPELTGNVSTDVSKNIYDLAGNCTEWTMEATTDYDDIGRVVRGGNFFYDDSVSGRDYDFPNYGYDNDGFRCTLYIK